MENPATTCAISRIGEATLEGDKSAGEGGATMSEVERPLLGLTLSEWLKKVSPVGRAPCDEKQLAAVSWIASVGWACVTVVTVELGVTLTTFFHACEYIFLYISPIFLCFLYSSYFVSSFSIFFLSPVFFLFPLFFYFHIFLFRILLFSPSTT